MGRMMPRNRLGRVAVILLGMFLLFGAGPYLIAKAIAQFSGPTISLDSPVTFPVDI